MADKILFADDDVLMRQLYGRHIKHAGYTLVEAVDGKAAVEAATNEGPALAVLDVVMPELSGIEALHQLKNNQATRKIPVILITSDSQFYSLRGELGKSGAACLLVKPFGPAQLLEAIRRHLPVGIAAKTDLAEQQ